MFVGCWVLAGLLHAVLFLVVPGFGVPAACRAAIRSSGNDIRGSVRLRPAPVELTQPMRLSEKTDR